VGILLYTTDPIGELMKLPLDAKVQLISQLTEDFVKLVESGEPIPESKTYTIVSSEDGGSSGQAARLAAFAAMEPHPITKLAFDTRRVDQENDRNPRKNLQYWHRTDQFIDDGDEKALKTFAKLAKVLKHLKKKLGTQPEWFESYARQLYDNVYRILRVKESDLDIFRPQMNYLEQLIFARYRLSMENLEKFSEDKIEQRILSKDEELIGRSAYLKETESDEPAAPQGFSKDSNSTTQESIVNAIFGGAGMRRDGERTVERTITITIRDNVID
jgi:hypothetical protein